MTTVFQGAVWAGIMIAIGGTVFLSAADTVVGAFLFSIGLLSILICKLNLFTGQIGYLAFAAEKTAYIKKMAVVWLGNLLGTFIAASALSFTRCGGIIKKAETIASVKLNDGILSIFVLSFFCGMLMFLAVNSFKTVPNELGKYLMVILCVSVFILSGFEHCVANMFYFFISGSLSLKAFLYILLMSVGNGLGALCLAIALKLYSKAE